MKQDAIFAMTATTFQGLEDVLAGELAALGAHKVRALRRAVSFYGDTGLLYRANLSLRTAIRVLKPILVYSAVHEQALYEGVRRIDWTKILSVRDTLAVNAVAYSKQFRNSQYVALKVKDAIVDQFRDRFGKRPSVDTDNPTVRINMHVQEKQCTLSLDSSGELLHRRGYRIDRGAAPLNECLAAGMVLISDWRARGAFVDPMCGAGTIPIEAALIGDGIAPGLLRNRFGFMNWRDFDERLWMQIHARAKSAVRKSRAPIIGFDIAGNVIRHARDNARRAGLEGRINFVQKPLETVDPPSGGGVAIMNPPYGVRLGGEIEQLYKKIGDSLKKSFTGYDAWILSANKEALKHVGLRASAKHTLFNGPMACAFQRYRMYQGSLKQKKRGAGNNRIDATGLPDSK